MKYFEAKDISSDGGAVEEAHGPDRTEHCSDSDDGGCPSPSLLFTALRSEEVCPHGSPVRDVRGSDAQSLDVSETLPASPELRRSFDVVRADGRPLKCNGSTAQHRTPPGEAVMETGPASPDVEGLTSREDRTVSTQKHGLV